LGLTKIGTAIIFSEITGLDADPKDLEAMRHNKLFKIKLPRTEPVEYKKLKEMYELLQNCLIAA